jgi:protein-tyrosine-phosphatase
MAMAIFRDMVKSDTDHWKIESAGTWAIEGAPAALKTQELSMQKGQDISEHRSRQVSKQLLGAFNLILTMEQGHKEALIAEFPEAARKVFTLSEMIGLNYDVPDPIGKSMEEFEESFREIEQTLKLGYERILRLATRQ